MLCLTFCIIQAEYILLDHPCAACVFYGFALFPSKSTSEFISLPQNTQLSVNTNQERQKNRTGSI